jgi:hypothetical protein
MKTDVLQCHFVVYSYVSRSLGININKRTSKCSDSKKRRRSTDLGSHGNIMLIDF